MDVKSECVFKKEIPLDLISLSSVNVNRRTVYNEVRRLSNTYLNGVTIKKMMPDRIIYLEDRKVHSCSYYKFLTRINEIARYDEMTLAIKVLDNMRHLSREG